MAWYIFCNSWYLCEEKKIFLQAYCTWTELIGSFAISSWTYQSSTSTLSITISSPVASPVLILMSVNSFVYPMTSLSSWPASGGATITVTSSGGTSKGIATNVKLSGVSSGSIKFNAHNIEFKYQITIITHLIWWWIHEIIIH